MTSNKVVTATFTQNAYSLTVTTVGTGSVTRNNTGPYHYGDAVELTAVPVIGWSFDHWSGDLSGSANPGMLTITGDKAVTATFTQNVYALTVTTVGSGSVNLNNTGAYHYGDVVRLTAVPSAGWSFESWSGDLLGSANPATILINGNKAVTATFTQNAYVLTVSVVGSGSVAKVPDHASYHLNDVVQLAATPSAGWSFSAWSGDFSSSVNPVSVIVNETTSVTATFAQNTYTLTVTTVGTGSVNRNNTGPYHYGDMVQLTANPTVGWSFDHWSGDLTGSVNPATIIMIGNMAVTATFTQNTYTLTVTTIGSGSVVLNNTGPYHIGDAVQCAANPTVGWSFDHWSGDLSGSINPATIVIDGNKAVTATFTQNTYTLTVSIAPVGAGSVNLNNTGPYHYGDVVRLTAVPGAGWSFSAWSGALTGSTNPASLTITGNMGVTATFAQNTYTLTVTTIGSGSVNLNNTGPYHYGDMVQFTAVPATGWSFSVWSGDLSGFANPTALVVNGNKAVTATFTQNTYTLAVSIVGSGAVNLNNSGPYHYGDAVQLTAVWTTGWSFQSWSGDLLGSVNPATILVTGNMAVTATFLQNAYSLTVSTVGSGSVVKVPDQGVYGWGTNVTLTATPIIGWNFDHWSGDASGTVNPITVNITSDKTITATFTQNTYTLTVTLVGSGSVNLNNSGPYHYGDVVRLTAVPVTGWSFQSWSGDLTGSASPTTILISGNKAVTATFAQNTYTLTVATVGSGSVNSNSTGPYHYGDVVQLTAVSAAGWSFDHWSGDLTGSVNPATIIMIGNMAVTATFMQQCLVTFYTDPAGSGYNITFQEQTYLNDTTATFPFGTSGLATAGVPSGWVFDHWISTDNVFVSNINANPTTVTITSNGTLKAVYAPEMDFSVARSPSSRSIAAGSTATFTVTASLLYGTSQSVSFSCLGLPPDATASFSPASGLPTFSSTLKISTGTSTPPGTYTITVAGSSQYASRWTTLQLKIMNFSVAPTPFSPNGDGVKDTTTVESTFWDSLTWTLTVKNTTGSVVRNLGTGSGSSVSMTWDGRDDLGNIVIDGTYTVSLILPGLTKTGSVVLDTTRPTVTCSWSRSTFNPRSGQTSKLAYTLSEKCSIYIQIYDSAGNLVRTLLAPTTKNKGTFSVTWNGKDDSGVIVPSGTYSCKIFAEDMAGNQVSPYPTACQIAVS
jgi:flagellar hook assembly protein FlgD